jgi:peptidoglycan/xylan/chitin deacetylase (PgdA/CDA1 family)
MKFITTSWDDGHPADKRLSALLQKYDLEATFYIPRFNERHPVMEEEDIASLSRRFEIGGHTLNHVNLTRVALPVAIHEIRGCFRWLQGLTGNDPESFCPPYGAFGDRALDVIKAAGFRRIRTTELLSTDMPAELLSTSPPAEPSNAQTRLQPSGSILHTTLQVFPHSGLTYLKHLVLRRRFGNLLRWRRSGYADDLFRLLDYYLEEIDANGGCFHLWGHSWEIEEYDLWDTMDQIFRRIARLPGFQYVANKDLTSTILS